MTESVTKPVTLVIHQYVCVSKDRHVSSAATCLRCRLKLPVMIILKKTDQGICGCTSLTIYLITRLGVHQCCRRS